MEDMKVGEYVRTNGRIYKVLDMDNVFLYVDKEVRYSEEYNASIHYINRDEYEIEKHSPNIIDLIEKGDFVNGFLVDRKDRGVVVVLDYFDTKRGIEPKDIKTILTKEQYKANCYEVK